MRLDAKVNKERKPWENKDKEYDKEEAKKLMEELLKKINKKKCKDN